MIRTESIFHESGYEAINRARLDHLASLGLPLANKTVLEVGAGIGDLSPFFIDKRCKIAITDGRQENVNLLRLRYPSMPLGLFDVENPMGKLVSQLFEVVFCYGLLYHTSDPQKVIRNLANRCVGLLLLESCVSLSDRYSYKPVVEQEPDPRNSIYGAGCHPSRLFVQTELSRWFPYVYMPLTQPDHPDFPLDWETVAETPDKLDRAVFIASRTKLDNQMLTDEIPMKQALAGKS